MAPTLLQTDLSVTISEFVDGVYGDSFGKCALRQTKFLLRGIVEVGTTLVSALARGLRPDRRTAPKKQREMVSRHLQTLDLLPRMSDWLAKQVFFTEDTPVAVDCFDLSKTSGLPFRAFHIHGCGRYPRFVKIAQDNAVTLTSKAESLLAAIRVLPRETTHKFISGRPRKKSAAEACPGQMMLAL